jgi:cystathionine beta-lyase/cystathionine gamma-synthase
VSRKLTGKFATRAIHVGQEADPVTGSVVPPLHQTTTFAQDDIGQHRGFIYSRAKNPTRTRLEENLASLEGGQNGLAFASGMSALSALVMHFKAGDHFIIGADIYGGTYRVFEGIFNRFKIQRSWVDTRSLDNVAAAVNSDTRGIIIETPSNPMMVLTDIEAAAQLAHDNNLKCIVDNTFMSPYCQRPLEMGAHVVFHSVTKYLAGHSDVLMGALITSDSELAEDLHYIQKSVGSVPSPFDCWLTSRSLKTLAVRMEQHCRAAALLAQFLANHPGVSQVFYPGLDGHPQHELASRQQRSPAGESVYGGMISIDVGSLDRARAFIKHLQVFTLAESLGGVESLVEHPAIMTHASVPPERREILGITEGLVRLSIGIEDIDDLQADLTIALDSLG